MIFSDIATFLHDKSALGGLIAFVFGIGVRAIDRIMSSKRAVSAGIESDHQTRTELRDELRKQLQDAREYIEELQKESDQWRGKYWREVASHSKADRQEHREDPRDDT